MTYGELADMAWQFEDNSMTLLSACADCGGDFSDDPVFTEYGALCSTCAGW